MARPRGALKRSSKFKVPSFKLNLCWPLKWPGGVVEWHDLRGRSSMGERLVRNQEAEGSTPFGSTIRRAPGCRAGGDSFAPTCGLRPFGFIAEDAPQEKRGLAEKMSLRRVEDSNCPVSTVS